MPPYHTPLRKPDSDFFTPAARESLMLGPARPRRLDITWPSEIDEHVQVLAFDLRYPVDSQLAIAREILRGLKRRSTEQQSLVKLAQLRPNLKESARDRPKYHTDQFAYMLRVFDAAWSGASDEEIVGGLYPKEQRRTLSKNSKAAMIEALGEQERWLEAGIVWKNRKLEDAVAFVTRDFREMLKWAGLPAAKRKSP